jgi:hypothetical protein
VNIELQAVAPALITQLPNEIPVEPPVTFFRNVIVSVELLGTLLEKENDAAVKVPPIPPTGLTQLPCVALSQAAPFTDTHRVAPNVSLPEVVNMLTTAGTSGTPGTSWTCL